MKDLNGNTWNLEKAITALYEKFRDEFDDASDVRRLATSLQLMYDCEKSIEKFFLPHATEEYRQYYRALVYVA